MNEASTTERLQLDILQMIGELRQQVGVVQAQNEHIIKSQDVADERRREMYVKLNKIDAIERELQRIVPLVDIHEQKHQQSIGALWMARGGWTIGGGAVGALVAWLLKAFLR